jgi:formylglycine-generating enzyme
VRHWVGIVAVALGAMCAGAYGCRTATCAERQTCGDFRRSEAATPEGGTDASSLADASASGPPSCAGLDGGCGPNGRDPCCDSPLVPGGTFDRCNDPAAPATVSPFHLDRFEVTVARFRPFVAAKGGTQLNPPLGGEGVHPKIPDSGWNRDWTQALAVDKAKLIESLKCEPGYATWTDDPGPNENLPINCVDWYEAFAFCIWDGGRLPTEAEWNYAATAGAEQRVLPWSDPPDAAALDCSFTSYAACDAGVHSVGRLSPKGDGKWSHSDLAGNVFEWVFDRSGTLPTPCIDCADLRGTAIPQQTRRGGGFRSGEGALLISSRGADYPFARQTPTGIRCARDR